MNSFPLFVPDKKPRLNNDELFAVMLIAVISPSLFEVAILNSELSYFSIIPLALCPLIFISAIIVSLYNLDRYRTLNGDLKGEIVFTNDSIVVNGVVNDIDNLIKIDFKVTDYKGFRFYHKSFRPKLSNGTDNTVSLKLKDKRITYHFQVLKKGDMNNVRMQLINYHLQGKLHWLQLLNILGYSEYEDIQEFKKEVSLLSNKINFLH
jgi:hypothetical protein